MSQLTKKEMMNTFLELLEKKSLDKITVKDITEKCGINRNTFYYYYKDINDLIDDIFEEEEKRLETLENSISDWNVTLMRAARIILNNRSAILNVYNSKSRYVLENYLYTASKKSLSKYISMKNDAKNRLSEDNIEFLCDFYSYTAVGMINHWIIEERKTDPEQFLEKVSNIMEVSVDAAIMNL